MENLHYFGAAIGLGMVVIGAALGIAKFTSAAAESIARQPEAADKNLTHLVVYRDRNHEVNFIEANPVTARLIQLIASEDNKTGQALLEQIATELNHPQPEIVINGGLEILTDLKKRDVILV